MRQPVELHRLFPAIAMAAMALLCLLMMTVASAEDSVCAVVKIEIKQELTLERQAFDANMIISNGLDDIPLEDVTISVNFTDEQGAPVLASSNPNDTNAKFFIRVDTMDGIDTIDGSGSVAPASTADIHWLIIPAPGAAEDAPLGKLYFVGATLSYTFGGEPETVEVIPDQIVVKPLPRLTLDYFLERDVFADDPFTAQIEPSEPFTLGVRVRNNGQAVASNVKIDSAQPKIVENEQGLAIGFAIIGSFVSDQPVAPTLLINVGDIKPDNAKMGRWQMTTTLSGEFTAFTAEFTHADELGGALTSILDATNTHFLVKDVLVDLPGRDTVLDFLADDGDALRVYESNNVDTTVTDHSSQASFSVVNQTGGLQQYTLSSAPTEGAFYVRLPDTFGSQSGGFQGGRVIEDVIRSDGKRIPATNAWFSKSRNASNGFDHFINIFDVNTTGQYTVILGNRADIPVAPAIQFVPDRRVVEGKQIAFIVEASDANKTIPVMAIDPIPPGAVFSLNNTDNTVATYVFNWTPSIGQTGRYEISYTATDGVLSSSRRAFIDVLSANDSDGDGLDDQWELENFGTLDRDGTGDFDGDGISDLDEFLQGTDPTLAANSGPTTPVIESPLFGTEVATPQPTLTIRNSTAMPAVPLTYDFEVYADAELTQLVAVSTAIDEQLGLTTAYQVRFNLQENTPYYWRARAFNGVLYSQWVNGEFFVNNIQEPPGVFVINNPVDGGEVNSLTPLLSVTNSIDPDRDPLTYTFEVFADDNLTTLVATATGISEGIDITEWQVDVPLAEDVDYYWRATATDDTGLTAQTAVARFFSTSNRVPSEPVINSPMDGSEVIIASIELIIDNATDLDGDPLNYFFELDTINTFNSAALQRSEEVIGGAQLTAWTVDELQEDTLYFWRARASDGLSESGWVQASFTVNAVNSAPSVPTIENPGDRSWVATLTPTLKVMTVADPDDDTVSYQFQLYRDESLTLLVGEFESIEVEWLLTERLTDNTWYFWRVRAIDDNQLASDWSNSYRFFVDDNGFDDTPLFEFVHPTDDVTISNGSIDIRWNDEDPDSSATITLYYDLDDNGADGVLVAGNIDENSDGIGDIYAWDVSALENRDYSLYAVISDGNSETIAYAPGIVTVDNSPDDDTGSDESSGGGCNLNENATFDPLFPFMLLLASYYLWQRRTRKTNVD